MAGPSTPRGSGQARGFGSRPAYFASPVLSPASPSWMIPAMEHQAPNTVVDSPQDILLDSGQSTGHATGQSTELSTGQIKSGLTAIEAAKVAGVHPRTIRRAIAAGHLVAPKQDGAYQIDPADLATWQAVHAPQSSPASPVDTPLDSPGDRSVDTRVDSPPDIGQTLEVSGGLSRGQSTGHAHRESSQDRRGEDGRAVAELWRVLEQEHRTALAAKDAQIAQAVADAEAVVTAKDQTIGELSTDVVYLRQHLDQVSEQLEQRSRELAAERERADVIQQLALTRIEALTSVSGDHRQDEPGRAPEPPGRDEGVREGDPASWWSRTWRKVIGSS